MGSVSQDPGNVFRGVLRTSPEAAVKISPESLSRTGGPSSEMTARSDKLVLAMAGICHPFLSSPGTARVAHGMATTPRESD